MSALFSPITIKHVKFRNRVVMPPMVCAAMPGLVQGAPVEGVASDASVEHYARRARAGTGLIIVEATAVDEGGRCWKAGLGAYADRHVPGLKRLAQAIHSGGAVAGIQLVHGGPQGSPELCAGGLVGPSDVAATESQPQVRALSVEEIHTIQKRFADAAGRAAEAGFDLVEVHGAHGFLLDSFLMAARNRRTDEYGGTVEGRMRMLLETCRRVRQRIGERTLLDCRISIFNKRDEGFTASDLEKLVRGLEGAGVDVIHVSTDGAFRGYFGAERTIGQWAKQFTNLPIIVAGGLGNPADAERLIADGHADFAAVGSAMLSDPEWTRHAAEQLAA